jgi:hypothetical protein
MLAFDDFAETAKTLNHEGHEGSRRNSTALLL